MKGEEIFMGIDVQNGKLVEKQYQNGMGKLIGFLLKFRIL